MAVPYRERKESCIEFLNNFHKLRKDVIMWLCRDFGFKKSQYTFDFVKQVYEMDNDTAERFKEFVPGDTVLCDKYPQWLVECWRNTIMHLLDQIGSCIEIANSIYVTNEDEKTARRHYLSLAIGNCNALKDKLNEIITFTNNIGGCLEIISKELEKEISLLKGVRKKTRVITVVTNNNVSDTQGKC